MREFAPMIVLMIFILFFLFATHRYFDIQPFGVEEIYGVLNFRKEFPESTRDVIKIVRDAINHGQKITVIGAGFSQGTQTIPISKNAIVIDMCKMKKMQYKNNILYAEAGCTWDDVVEYLDKFNRSVIVKQASNPFSIGGSIAINCHGWAQTVIANTVKSLCVVDASGYKILTPRNPEFGCFFGTLGYFGVIVAAEFITTENTMLQKISEKMSIEKFIEFYYQKQNDKTVQLLIGRLNIDDPPLKTVYAEYYIPAEGDIMYQKFSREKTKIDEKIGLCALGILPENLTKSLIAKFWKKEIEKIAPMPTTRNLVMRPPINAINAVSHRMLPHSLWLQEYFIYEESLPQFISFLSNILSLNNVPLLNASIRIVEADKISILPYADHRVFAVVICFSQNKSDMLLAREWIRYTYNYILQNACGRWYQAYMPFATREEFSQCYNTQKLHEMKKLYDPNFVFGNAHTEKYYTKIDF